MPEIAIYPPASFCNCLYPRPRFEELNYLVLIPFCLTRTTRAGVRQRKLGQSARPAARYSQSQAAPPSPGCDPGIASRPLSAQALSDLLDRKPHPLRLLAAQFLPPPLYAPSHSVLVELQPVRDSRC